jgi:hypothetical protein
MAIATWSPYLGVQVALSSQLNALGNGNTALSAAISNSANLSFFMDLVLNLATVNLAGSASALAANKNIMFNALPGGFRPGMNRESQSGATTPTVLIWLLSCVDGVNYEDGTAGTPGIIPARQPDAVIQLRSVNGPQIVNFREINLPPGTFKILLKNNTQAALAASGNSLSYNMYSEAVA